MKKWPKDKSDFSFGSFEVAKPICAYIIDVSYLKSEQ